MHSPYGTLTPTTGLENLGLHSPDSDSSHKNLDSNSRCKIRLWLL